MSKSEPRFSVSHGMKKLKKKQNKGTMQKRKKYSICVKRNKENINKKKGNKKWK